MSTFISVAEATTYFATRLSVSEWTAASDDDKLSAITMATDYINQLNFVGTKTDPDQELEFPRNDETEIPSDIKKACAELALELLKGVDLDQEIRNQYLETYSAAGIRSTFNRDVQQREDTASGIPCRVAWNFLRKYLRNPASIKLERAS